MKTQAVLVTACSSVGSPAGGQDAGSVLCVSGHLLVFVTVNFLDNNLIKVMFLTFQDTDHLFLCKL